MKGEGNHQYGLCGEKNASWRGGKALSNYGYIEVYCPDHPFGDRKSPRVFEHRLVAEKYLLTEENSIEIDGKRYLKPEYEVHHKDFCRTNNDVSNLVVLTKAEHNRLHSRLNAHKRDEKTGRFLPGKMIFKKVVPTAELPKRATDGSAGYDMYAELESPVEIPPHKSVMIKSGIAVSLPKNCAGFIYARSGLSTKFGLRPSTCVSVIDSDYRGEIGLPIYNDSDETRTINPHDRIAQMVISKVIVPEIEIVDSFDDTTERSDAGFGSTGR